ncbi:MAG: hypothetical protein WBD22_02945 [Pyrinomonadaceae bacterium]
MIGLNKIAPGQTIQIDVKKLRDQQIPDERGNLIPQNLTEGQLQWTIRADRFDESEPLKKFKLVGRSEQIDLINKTSSSYACQNCCQVWYEGFISSGGVTEAEIGDQIQFVVYERVTNCNTSSSGFYLISNSTVDWDSNNDNIATVDDNGLVTIVGVGEVEIDGDWWRDMTSDQGGYCPGPFLTGKSGPNEKTQEKKTGRIASSNLVPDCNSCLTELILIDSDVELVAKPKITNVTATGATKISQIVGDPKIIHFVTPKGAANDQVTLTAELNPNTEQIRNQISWEGATESASNPLEATIPKSSAGKNIVKIKYGTKVLKEMRVWVVWSTITSPSDFPIESSSNGLFGRPPGIGLAIRGGYRFNHTIAPAAIITDTDGPNFTGSNSTSPPGGNHPISGLPLSGGADKKWDVSRQIRLKVLSSANISNNDFTQPAYPSSVTYPLNDIEGNDNARVLNENNDPYSNNGILTDSDRPEYGIVDRAAIDGDTYEARLQFKEFTRLEIEGTWFRISDYFFWRIHLKFLKANGLWTDDSTSKALDNNGF